MAGTMAVTEQILIKVGQIRLSCKIAIKDNMP